MHKKNHPHSLTRKERVKSELQHARNHHLNRQSRKFWQIDVPYSRKGTSKIGSELLNIQFRQQYVEVNKMYKSNYL